MTRGNHSMIILQTPGWDDYSLLDTGNGKRLEQFGKYRLVRPDPQIIWKPKLPNIEWERADAVFENGEKGKRGQWVKKKTMPEEWSVQYNDIIFNAKLSPFKHTGIFPEQSLQWEWMEGILQKAENNGQRDIKVLNLFAYTGGASLIAAKAGAKVTHVDASKPSISWAHENQEASHLSDKPIRWILEDVLSFVRREVKRGNTYEGIIMDPPVFGHGPEGERWEFNESFPELLHLCKSLLSKEALFIIINAYAISSSSLMLENSLSDIVEDLQGEIEVGELALEEKTNHRLLSTGIFARWSVKNI